MTYYLRFPDEATAQAALTDYYDVGFGWCTASLIHALDPVGTIYKNDGVFDDQGNVIKEPTQIDGWHVNFIGKMPENILSYQIAPKSPLRIFAT